MRNLTDTGVGARLNLGCGDDVKEGYLNVDFRRTHPSVHEVDLSKYPWPLADRSAKEILMLDFLEHFPYANTPFILLECYRILEDDGEVIIQVPDAGHVCRAMLGIAPFLCHRCGTDMSDLQLDRDVNEDHHSFEQCPACGAYKDEIAEAAIMRLFGGQDYPGNFHQTAFTKDMLMQKASQAGLVYVTELEHKHQYANWNFKLKFKKGSVW